VKVAHVTGHLRERVACGIDRDEYWLNDGTVGFFYVTYSYWRKAGSYVEVHTHQALSRQHSSCPTLPGICLGSL
jgi:hypothetical protein